MRLTSIHSLARRHAIDLNVFKAWNEHDFMR